MVDAWLMAHWTPLALGLMALTPIGERSNLFPDARRRITIGLGLILLGGSRSPRTPTSSTSNSLKGQEPPARAVPSSHVET